MCLVGVKKRLQMKRLWIKKEKMAAHPIAEASITLYLSLPLSLTEGSQLGRAAANQERETASEENEEGEEAGEAVPLLLLLPECFATAASRLTGLLRDSHTFGLLSF